MKQIEFINVVASALGVDSSTVTMDLKIGDIREWDSLGHLTILTSLDAYTGEKASEISNFGSLDSLSALWSALVNAGLASNS
jgi:hypothetical protein